MHVSAIEAHRRWAPTYDANPNPLLALEHRLLAGVAPKTLLDIACGTGRWMLHFAERGATVIGVDACKEMLAKALEKPPLHGRVTLADAAALPFPAACADLTLCSFAAGYFPDLPAAVQEMARVTRPGGQVIISDLHPSALAAGWTRSFRDGDTVYTIASHHRSEDEALAAASGAGLCLDRIVSGSFGEPERAIFRAAGKEHLFEQTSQVPAVWIGIWNRPCGSQTSMPKVSPSFSA
ncbi:MAG TPA: class I SAM-dependent methyltransferase [Candidatus Acidoferrum sp.]|nr:class I SAM-dependent methyltransferase [Candidatus Acidoferrum sp.]